MSGHNVMFSIENIAQRPFGLGRFLGVAEVVPALGQIGQGLLDLLLGATLSPHRAENSRAACQYKAGASPAVTMAFVAGKGGMSPSDRGGTTEAVVMAALAKAGYLVLLPIGVARYDLAIDRRDGTGIKTVQVKTARVQGGCITWWSASFRKETGQRSSYTGEVDYFGVWCPGLDDAYLVPVDLVASREGRLRLLPTANNQQAGIRWADEFLIK